MKGRTDPSAGKLATARRLRGNVAPRRAARSAAPMKEGPFKVETQGAGRVINAPGMIITAGKDGTVKIGIEAIAAQLNRAHEAGKVEKRAEDDAAEVKLSDTHRVQRDGWRAIAEALIAVGLGYEMRGFGETPPREILEALGYGHAELSGDKVAPPDTQVLEAIRDSLVGRAWRVRGSQGAGTCDYPLCPNRAASKAPPSFVDVQIVAGVKLHTCTGNVVKRDTDEGAGIKAELQECHRWALWVQQRAAAGRIDVAR